MIAIMVAFLLVALIFGVYLAVEMGVGKIADKTMDPLIKRAKDAAGRPVKDPETGEETVPWQHRPLGTRNAVIVMVLVGIMLMALFYWIG